MLPKARMKPGQAGIAIAGVGLGAGDLGVYRHARVAGQRAQGVQDLSAMGGWTDAASQGISDDDGAPALIRGAWDALHRAPFCTIQLNGEPGLAPRHYHRVSPRATPESA